MKFVPKYSNDEVDAMIATGNLSAFEIYQLKHQHPLNKLTHIVGIPVIGASVAYPVYVWISSGVIAWKSFLVLSLFGWGLQFLGHAIEGNRPAFFQDPRHFVVGPIHFFVSPFISLYRRLKDG